MKPSKLMPGDTVAIVSLSSGMLGEIYVAHELSIALKRLLGYGFKVKLMPNALKGVKYLDAHPEKRAQDLLAAFNDTDVKAIICAIGGIDTYRLAPYLFENGELEAAVRSNPKIFMGFSDTTVNHLMLHKCGLNTFYGQALIPDLAELDNEMLPYTKKCFEQLFIQGRISKITPSDIWYDERKTFSLEAVGTKRTEHIDNVGFELLGGDGVFGGRILGGCVETLSDMLTGSAAYQDEKEIVEKYGLFPDLNDWKGRILLLETSEEQLEPSELEKMLRVLESYGLFNVVSGVIIGKPMDERYYDEYKRLYIDIIGSKGLSVLYNVNVGHATPRCIIPFGVTATVNADEGVIRIDEDILI